IISLCGARTLLHFAGAPIRLNPRARIEDSTVGLDRTVLLRPALLKTTLTILEQIPDTLPRRKTQSRPQNWADVVVIGAGPTGLACAIEAQRVGLRVLVLDKGCLVNSLFHYPANMTFFTTPELLEIGEIPFATANMKPTRQEALEYYRRVTEKFELKVLQYHWVKTVTGEDNNFRVTATDRSGGIHDFEARKIIVATGYYDLPNLLNIPGEDLPKVNHYYREPHPYYDSDVLVIGGKNSAAIAALELWRHGAHVTLVYRGPQMHSNVKYWIKPDIENRIKNHEIAAYFKSCVTEIANDYVVIKTPPGSIELDNDFV